MTSVTVLAMATPAPDTDRINTWTSGAMKFITKFLLVAVFGLSYSLAPAETFSNEVLTFSVPDGFVGPTTGAPGLGANVTAYTKPYSGTPGGTLLQISTYDFRSALEGMPEEERGNASEYYLGQFLGGVERKRTSFSASRPERLSLGGLTASRVTWTGRFNGLSTSGVMYCLIIGTTVVSLHTQDIDGAPTGNRSAAIAAFEGLIVRDGN